MGEFNVHFAKQFIPDDSLTWKEQKRSKNFALLSTRWIFDERDYDQVGDKQNIA